MVAGGAGVLVVIVIGILLLQGAMVPARRTGTASVESSRSPSPDASYAIAYASPSMSIPTPTAVPAATPSVDQGGVLEEPDQDPPTAQPDPTPSPTPKPTPKPTPRPTPTPTPTRTSTPGLEGVIKVVVRDTRHGYESTVFSSKGTSVEAIVDLSAPSDLDRSGCSLVQVIKPDDPSIAPRDVTLEPLATQTVELFDGWNTFGASCATPAGLATASVRAVVHDGQPEACKDFEFVRDEISVTSFDELASGVIGTWVGCATTPWTPMYKVTFVLRDDGTYSAKSGEGLDGQRMYALYYTTDKDSALKRYYLTDLQASGLGLGEIDLDFGHGSVVRDQIRNIRLMGDKLEFEIFHDGVYGPIAFRLNRAS